MEGLIDKSMDEDPIASSHVPALNLSSALARTGRKTTNINEMSNFFMGCLLWLYNNLTS